MAAVGAVMAATLGIAGASWACTSSASLSSSPNYGPTGSNVTVTGSSFTDGRVEIRWNAVSGPLIGEATGPNFSITVKIPNAVQDNYVILAVATDASGVTWKMATPFEVTAAGAVQTQPNRPSRSRTGGSTGTTSASTSGATSETSGTTLGETASGDAGGSEAASSTDSQDAADSSQTSGSPVLGGSVTATAADSRRSTGPSAPAGAQATSRGRRSGTSASAVSSTGQSSSGTAPGAVAGPAGSPSAPVDSTATPDMAPSPRTATDDLWGGFAAVTDTPRGPALVGPAAPEPAGGATSMALGAGLLSAGLVALTSGAAVAGVKRRRARVAIAAS